MRPMPGPIGAGIRRVPGIRPRIAIPIDRALERRRCAERPAGLAVPRTGHRATSASVLARSHRLEAQVTSPPSRRHPWNACRIFLSSTAPYPPLVPRVHRACSLPSAPTKVRRRTRELWRAHPFIAKTGSRPAIKAAHCPTRRPTSSSAIDAPRRAPVSRPYHHRPGDLTTSHSPTPPPRVVGCTACPAPLAGAELQRPPSHRTAGPAHRRPLHPVAGHKPSHGDTLVLPHLFPGQGRHRSRPQCPRTTLRLPHSFQCLFREPGTYL
jgi:hypothetical protein